MAHANPTLPPGYRIELFAEQDAVTHEQIIELWERETGMPPEVSGRRVHELLLVAVSPEGEAASVNSIQLERKPSLRLDLWFISTFTAREHRMQNLGLSLLLRACEHLEREFVEGRDTRAAGLGFELENKGLQARGNATGNPVGATFIGLNEREWPLWVRYFPGVRAPGPPA